MGAVALPYIPKGVGCMSSYSGIAAAADANF